MINDYDPTNITAWLGREIRTKSGSAYLVTVGSELMKLNDDETPLIGGLEMIAAIPPAHMGQFEVATTPEDFKTLMRLYGTGPEKAKPGYCLAVMIEGKDGFTTSKIKEIVD